jgi:5,6-dimethylbenzimidazole synthase
VRGRIVGHHGKVDPFDTPFQAELLRLFRLRRDVRRFRTEPVPEALLREVLEAAHLAPSVGLSQPWRFVRVKDPALKEAVRADFARCNETAASGYSGARAQAYGALKLAGLREAPEHLLICCERDPDQGHALGRRTQPETARDSAVCAIQLLWLAARAKGLGLGWVSILEPGGLRARFDLPETWDWVAYLCLGWPESEEPVPELETLGWERRRPLDAVLFER